MTGPRPDHRTAPRPGPDGPATGGPDALRRTETATGGTAPRPRLLVLRALGLGDLLAGVPALRALRRGFPGHELVLAAPAGLAPVAGATGAVDRVLPASAPGRAVPRSLDWTGPPPDVAVDLHGNGPPSHRLLSGLAPARLLAFAHPGTPEIEGPTWCAEEHERDRWCRLLRWYGVDADPTDLLLPPPDTASPAPGAVLLHPGAGAPARRWPVERYAAVATALRARGLRVVVTGGADEGDPVARLAERARLPDTDVFGGGPPFDRLSALVAGARAVVSGDTGIAHLAVAHAVPTVTLFGPVPPRRWGPPAHPRHIALWYGPEGDPHGRRPDPALLRITPDDVLDALGRLPAARRPGEEGAP
ncbi:glycosyltransferase family 9 protein [Streptomyces viridosporus]|uniref:Glycosyltransferase family 9 protein n=2 Tax=Streptomyces viridosporus TaxID=67581 RepID=A0ABX6AN57_STRVD|nr:glycosyltransferase family 9 protein [Streptomyces viridosporus]QEU88442.1 glycosyltransferase family 9 protein [Streptomyces viridosporus T7A]